MKSVNIVLLLLNISITLYAQDTIGNIPPPDLGQNPIQTQPRGTNYITCASYENITYNGYTIEQINATEGDFQQLWGAPTSVETSSGSWSKRFKYGTNRISFNTEFAYASNITIKDQQWPVKVLGKVIQVGDSFSELQQKFGQNLKIIYKPQIDPNYSVSFGCSGNDGDGLLIDLSPATNKVVKIIYFVNP